MAAPAKEFTVEVTAEDIEKGEQDRPHSCAIARALHRTRRGHRWYVDPIAAYYERPYGGTVYYKAKDGYAYEDFINRFDEDKSLVAPRSFTFVLDSIDI